MKVFCYSPFFVWNTDVPLKSIKVCNMLLRSDLGSGKCAVVILKIAHFLVVHQCLAGESLHVPQTCILLSVLCWCKKDFVKLNIFAHYENELPYFLVDNARVIYTKKV